MPRRSARDSPPGPTATSLTSSSRRAERVSLRGTSRPRRRGRSSSARRRASPRRFAPGEPPPRRTHGCPAALPGSAAVPSSSISRGARAAFATDWPFSSRSSVMRSSCSAAPTPSVTSCTMAETVLITTYDLEPAVRLKDAFQKEGYRVELLTSTESIADVAEPALLVLTGGLEKRRARKLVREAEEHDRLPIIGLADSPQQAAPDARRRLGLHEVFVKPIDVSEVALVGRRLIERRRLRQI